MASKKSGGRANPAVQIAAQNRLLREQLQRERNLSARLMESLGRLWSPASGFVALVEELQEPRGWRGLRRRSRRAVHPELRGLYRTLRDEVLRISRMMQDEAAEEHPEAVGGAEGQPEPEDPNEGIPDQVVREDDGRIRVAPGS